MRNSDVAWKLHHGFTQETDQRQHILSVKRVLSYTSLPKVSILILQLFKRLNPVRARMSTNRWHTHPKHACALRDSVSSHVPAAPPGCQPRAQRTYGPCHPSVPVPFWPWRTQWLSRAPLAREARRRERREAAGRPAGAAPPAAGLAAAAAALRGRRADDGWPVCRPGSQPRGAAEGKTGARAPLRAQRRQRDACTKGRGLECLDFED